MCSTTMVMAPKSYLRMLAKDAAIRGPVRRPTFQNSGSQRPQSSLPPASFSQVSRYSGCHGDRTGVELESVRGSPGPCTLLGRRSRPLWYLLEWLGWKWGVQPGHLLGTATFYEFQWLLERAGHDGGQVRVGGGFYGKGSGCGARDGVLWG